MIYLSNLDNDRCDQVELSLIKGYPNDKKFRNSVMGVGFNMVEISEN